MKRLLIDECLPVMLHRVFLALEARTVAYQGWAGESDTRLLARAARAFDVMLTADRDFLTLAIPAELAVIVLPSQRLAELMAMAARIERAALEAAPGKAILLPWQIDSGDLRG